MRRIVVFAFVLIGTAGLDARAQFLRLGPYDFTTTVSLDLIFTTNVEGERREEQITNGRDGEDLYLVPGIRLQSSAMIGPSLETDLSLGYSREQHFIRDDLDVDLGEARFGVGLEILPFVFDGNIFWTRDTEYVDDLFIPASGPDTRRKVRTERGYDFGAALDVRSLSLGVLYEYTEERYEDPAFELEEQNEETITYTAGYEFGKYVRVLYELEDSTIEFINSPDGLTEEETETITIFADQLFGLLERPEFTYGIGVQREYEEGETEGWEIIHTFSLRDEIVFSPVLTFDYFVIYSIEDNPEDDEVELQYGLKLDHDLSPDIRHSLYATRKPVDTFGSTDETDETMFGYELAIDNFLLRNVSYSALLTYEINDTPGEETEEIFSLRTGVEHTKVLSSGLARSISYYYTLEDSNQEVDLLEEHRVTLSYTYSF